MFSSDTKNIQKIESMRRGGLLLRTIKSQLKESVVVGISFEEIEALAQKLIREVDAVPNFSLVPGYKWATCVMKNDEMCHGIPKHKKVDDGDIISIDVGMLFEGWHLDTSISFSVGTVSPQLEHFLEVGKRSLKKAISKAVPGGSVYDVSFAMQKVVERAGYSAAHQLTGHAIGKELHMEPSIPCIAQKKDKRLTLQEGDTFAIEIMYAMGDATVALDSDGWTYKTVDSSVSAMFEETVLITPSGQEILT